LAEQLKVAACDEAPNVTLEARLQIKPAGLESEDSVTVPVKAFTAVKVIVDVPDAPASIWAGVTALAAIVKSTTWNVIGPVE
jgi:hypothetical protein